MKKTGDEKTAAGPTDKKIALAVAALFADGKVRFDEGSGAAVVSLPGVPDPLVVTPFRKFGGIRLFSVKTAAAPLPWAFDPRNLRETVESLEAAVEAALGRNGPEIPDGGPS